MESNNNSLKPQNYSLRSRTELSVFFEVTIIVAMSVGCYMETGLLSTVFWLCLGSILTMGAIAYRLILVRQEVCSHQQSSRIIRRLTRSFAGFQLAGLSVFWLVYLTPNQNAFLFATGAILLLIGFRNLLVIIKDEEGGLYPKFHSDSDKESKYNEIDPNKSLTESSVYKDLSFADRNNCHRFWNNVTDFGLQSRKDKELLRKPEKFNQLIREHFSPQRSNT